MLFCFWYKKPPTFTIFLVHFLGTLFGKKLIKEKTLLAYYFTVMLVKIYKFEVTVVIIGKNVYFGAFLENFSK